MDADLLILLIVVLTNVFIGVNFLRACRDEMAAVERLSEADKARYSDRPAQSVGGWL